MSDIHIRQSSPIATPRVKTAPKVNEIQTPFFYAPSDDGTDENLLILLHGLGDTHVPFSKLGKSLKLPQTAVLALRAPEQVPFLYEESFQWYSSFDNLGDLLDRPDPTSALDFLSKGLRHLTNDCAWPIHRIHLFGFGQGGTLAGELGVKWAKLQSQQSSGAQASFGSIVSISGPLLSYPTIPALSPTPILLVHRPAPSESALPAGAITSFKKAYSTVKEARLGSTREGMPSSKDEWESIMRFWSEHLGRRQVEGLYEVMTGSNNV